MPKQIRTKDITLSQSQKEHLENVIGHFFKFGLEITRVVANITKEKKDIRVEFEVHIAHTEPVIINEIDEKFDEALDKADSRVKKALRRLHDKLKSPKHESLRTILNEIE